MSESNNTKREFSWSALESPEYQKHPLWFVGYGIFMALIVLYGIYTKSWTTVVLFSICGVLGLMFAAKKPRKVQITVNTDGVFINDKAFPYAVVKKFWIIYHPSIVKALYLETTSYLNPHIRIELSDQNPNELREFLKEFLEEDLEGRETIPDLISRRIRF